MISARLLDVVLVLTLLVFIGEGWRNGLLRSLSAILGVIAGGVVAFLSIPIVAAIIPDPFWRIVIVVVVTLTLLFGGHAVGAAIARRARRGARSRARGRGRPDLGLGARIAGGSANGVVAALMIALIAGGVGALGMPLFSQAISGSFVLRAIDAVTPPPLDVALSRLRAAVLEQGLPTIAEALGGVQNSPGIPDAGAASAALAAAAQSVVRVGGTAYACGQNQTGSGFVVSDDRVVTNAHVLAGVDQPVVEAPNGQTLEGRVVYFDPIDDLAVIAVDGLDAPPLALSAPLAVGDTAVVEGYPFGGPFTTGPAEVLAISSERIADVYETSRSLREVYTLAALVQPGDSGGPLLATDGRVAGVIFARSATDAELGYAMTNTEVEPVAAAAPGLDAAISAGDCVRR